MKRILITGGAGFIGSTLALYLVEKNFEVTILDNLSPQIHGLTPEVNSPLYKSIINKTKFIKADVCDTQVLEKLVQEVDVIVHFAAETGTGQSMYNIDHYTKVNIQATAGLLDILTNKKHTVKKVVVASSRSIYGEGRYYHNTKGYCYPATRKDADLKQGLFEVYYEVYGDLSLVATDENSKLHPSSVYGITKLVQEQLIMTVCPNINIAPVALRYQNVYGPGQSLNNPYTGILSIFSTCILSGKPINIFEDGLESRDFVFIDDVVEATYLSIIKDEANNKVFNVGSGVATTVYDIAHLLTKLYKISVEMNVSGNYRIGDIRHNYADINLIKEAIGFVPKITLEEGLQKFTNWVLTQSVNANSYEKSLDELKQRGLLK